MKTSPPLLFDSQTVLKKNVGNYLTFVELKTFFNLASRSKYRFKTNFELLRLLCRNVNSCRAKNEIKAKENLMEVFTCKCGSVLHNPCTLSCGHTICRMCFTKIESCSICGDIRGPNFVLNVTLASIVERSLPDNYKAADLRWQAKEQINLEKFDNALKLLTESLKIVNKDGLTLQMRAEVNLKLSRTKDAYRDARRSCELNPENGEFLFTLGSVCAALNKLDDAVEAYQKCLECDPDNAPLYEKVCGELDSLLSMQFGPEVEVSDDETDVPVENIPDQDKKLSTISDSAKEKSIELNLGAVNERNCPETLPGSEDGYVNVPISETTKAIEELKDSPETRLNCDENEAEQPDIVSSRFLNFATPSSCVENVTDNLKKPDELGTESSPSCDDDNSVILDSNSTRCKRRLDSGNSQTAFTKKKAKTSSSQSPTIDDFECKLCFCLLYQPITTPCGHVFCKICLERCIDHSPNCPVCRGPLQFNDMGIGEITTVIQEAIEHYVPEELEQRSKIHKEHMEKMARVGDDEDVEVPIFACILVFPNIQYQFHIFEPKYRLMLRECLQSGSRKFGICIDNKEGGYSNFGTIVEVKFFKFLPDGRSIIDVVGVRRFKIADRQVSNGIPVAKVKYFEDELETSDLQCEQIANKCMAVYSQLSDYIGKLHPSERDCINKALGPIPLPSTDPAKLLHGESWVWWATAALPLSDKAKLMMFKSNAVLNRVTILYRFLNVLAKLKNSRNATGNL